MERELASGAVAIGALEAIEMNVADAVVHEEGEGKADAALVRGAVDADVAKIAGREQTLDGRLNLTQRKRLSDLLGHVLREHRRVESRIRREIDRRDGWRAWRRRDRLIA